MKNESYNSSFLVPDFVDIQRKSFFHLLKNGIIEEFSKINPIISEISQLKLTFYPKKFLLILPDLTVSEAILEGKTYSCKLYVPAVIDVHKAKNSFSMKKGFESHPFDGQKWPSNPRPTRGVKSSEANNSLSNRVYYPLQQLSLSSVSPTNINPDLSSLIKQESKTGRHNMTDSDVTPSSAGGFKARGVQRTPGLKTPKISESNWKAIGPRNVYVTNRTFALLNVRNDQPSINSFTSLSERRKAETTLYTNLTSTFSERGFASPVKTQVVKNPPLESPEVANDPLALERVAIEPQTFRQISSNIERNSTRTKNKEDNFAWILLGHLPLMTKRGHFIINGSPRVLVNQLTRCPGIYFQEKRWGVGKTEKRVVYADFVSRRGAWLRLQADKAGDVWARLKRTPKIPFSLFYESMIACERTPSQWTYSDKEALIELYEEVNPTKRESSAQSGKAFLDQKFKNPRTYDLGLAGRDQLNKRLGNCVLDQQLTSKDLYYAFEQIKELQNQRIFADDIDNLSNRQVRAAGDLVQGQLETGLYRLEKAVVGKMRNLLITESKDFACKRLLTTKPLNGAFREFFGSSPLSQYMDQTNPLAEITQKRRISSLGPGGISRETAGMAIRGIHPTHYGRICPIETPEGKNAGLVNSLTAFTKVRIDGTLESPYYPILQGQVQSEFGFTFLGVETEEQYSTKITPGDINTTASRFLPNNSFPIREAGNPQEDFRYVNRERAGYIAVSPVQMISIATSLIPFLEHDDANRALMGSNMQRQAVPLLRPERPIVGTGLEALVVASSGHAVVSHVSGYISSVSNEKIVLYLGSSRSQGDLPSKAFSYVSAAGGVPLKNPKSITGKKIQATNLKIDKVPSVMFYKPPSSYQHNIARRTSDDVVRRFGSTRDYETKSFIKRLKNSFSQRLKNSFSQRLKTFSREENQGLLEKISITYLQSFSNHFLNQIDEAASSPNQLGVVQIQAPQPIKRLWTQSFKARKLFKKGFAFTNKVTSLVSVRKTLTTQSFFTSTKDWVHNSSKQAKIIEPTAFRSNDLTLYKKVQDDVLIPKVKDLTQKSVWYSLGIARYKNLSNSDYSFGKEKFNQNELLGEVHWPKGMTYTLQSYCRSNQETCLNHIPAITEGEWIQEGDLLADCSASQFGELALGKNVLIAYLPWEGYNFEDAVVISERLVLEDVYTSIHIQRYEVETKETKFGFESITPDVPGVHESKVRHLDKNGIATIGSSVKEGDILVGKVSPKGLQPLSPYERLAYDIANVEAAMVEDTSLRVPKGVEGIVINYQIYNEARGFGPSFESSLSRVRIYLAEERRVKVGDKIAGRHGNKGIVSTILPRQDMPYLPNGKIVDIILNPLGIPSRMNVGQVFECLLGLAGMQLGQHFQVTPFDEIYGAEASRSLVYLKLYQAKLRTDQNWIFDFNFPGKVALFDGRTGQLFDQWVTVGYAYMLKLVHMVDEKIHARSTGPYSLVTKQPLGGRSKQGGQRLGEMEVWALEGFGAAYILQEMLTCKSDDIIGREQVVDAILFKEKMSLGNPEAFKVLVRELQSLCLDIGIYAISSDRLHREVIDVGSTM
jgi:DNA-directed RNA polymerase subunit beta